MNFGGDHSAPDHGKISARCVPEGASDGKNTGSWQHIACMYSNTANLGKIYVLCIQKAPQSAIGEYAARTSCRQGAFSPSEAPKSCTAHESCRPLMDLTLAQGCLPEQLHRGIAFQRLGPCPGGAYPPSASPIPATCRYPPPANTCHLPIPAARCTHCSQRQAADELRRRSSGSWPTVRPSPEGPPTASSRRAGRQRNAAQNWAWIPEP